MERKIFKIDLSKDLKLEDGQGRAIIATLNVEDHDGDVLLPGVIGKEQHASILPAHDRRAASMGKAIVREVGNHLIADFKFNLDADHKTSREWHSSLKFDRDNGIPVQEWSFGLVNMKTKQGPFGESNRSVNFIKSFDIPEVSPVLQGASIGTTTLSIKDKKNMTFKEEMEHALTQLTDVKALIDRAKSLTELRLSQNRPMSDDNIKGLQPFMTLLTEVTEDCKNLDIAIQAEVKSVDAVQSLARHQKTILRYNELLGAK